MGYYIIKRILSMIPVLLAVAFLIFTLLHFTPGDPAEIMLGENVTPEQVAIVHAELGLDKPFIVQLGVFLKELFIDFDLGTSYRYDYDVMQQFLIRLPLSAIIALFACSLQVIVAVPLGVTAAVHQHGWQDRLCVLLSMLGTAMPEFWFAMILIVVFSLNLGWLPSFGVEHWYNFILPCVAIGLRGVGNVARQTRSQMLEVIRADYVVTARAKGVSEKAILYVHALPNALIPVITSIGGNFGRALGGTVVIENVFAIPGVGHFLVNAIGQRDYPVVRGTVVLLTLMFSVVMLLVDLCYAYVDPRIKAQYEGQHKRRLIKNG